MKRDNAEAAVFFGAIEDHDHCWRAVQSPQCVCEGFIATRELFLDDEVHVRCHGGDEGDVWEGFAEE